MDSRLSAALELLRSGLCGRVDAVADIGCDHGKLSLAILEAGLADRVVASDISAASLGKTMAAADERGLSNRLCCRIADGFSACAAGEVQAAAICGMGGELIASIIEAHSVLARGLECIVMQPMRGEAELREYLYTHSYRIFAERVVCDGGRYYQLMAARSGSPEPLPGGWPKGYYQFGALAYERGEAELEPMLRRYLGIMQRKLESSPGKAPASLVREIECSEKILELIATKAAP